MLRSQVRPRLPIQSPGIQMAMSVPGDGGAPRARRNGEKGLAQSPEAASMQHWEREEEVLAQDPQRGVTGTGKARHPQGHSGEKGLESTRAGIRAQAPTH